MVSACWVLENNRKCQYHLQLSHLFRLDLKFYRHIHLLKNPLPKVPQLLQNAQKNALTMIEDDRKVACKFIAQFSYINAVYPFYLSSVLSTRAVLWRAANSTQLVRVWRTECQMNNTPGCSVSNKRADLKILR